MYVHSHQTISTSHMYNFDIFSLGPNHSYFAQGIYLINKTENIPCAILEWSNTILELRNQVGILTLRRAILEWYRFLLCAEHIHLPVCKLPARVYWVRGLCVSLYRLQYTVKLVLSGQSKRRQKMGFKTNYHLMHVKSIPSIVLKDIIKTTG